MTDRTATEQRHDTDRTRLSAAEAARVLGITPDAIRARIRRGTLEAERDGQAWFVWLPRSPTGQRHDATEHRPDGDQTRPDALISHLTDEIGYLRTELAKRSEELARRDDLIAQIARDQAAERERFDILHREALGRIEALTAGTVQEPPSGAPHAPGAPIETPRADDPFTANGAAQDASGLTDELTAQWSDLTEQLIAELAMDPQAAMLAAAADLGIPYEDGSATGG
jgi:hypothetical protein